MSSSSTQNDGYKRWHVASNYDYSCQNIGNFIVNFKLTQEGYFWGDVTSRLEKVCKLFKEYWVWQNVSQTFPKVILSMITDWRKHVGCHKQKCHPFVAMREYMLNLWGNLINKSYIKKTEGKRAYCLNEQSLCTITCWLCRPCNL